jgi:putative ABC transport system permease protein
MSKNYIITDLYFIVDPSVSISESNITTETLQTLPENTLYSPIAMSYLTTSNNVMLTSWGVDIKRFIDVRNPRIWGQEPNQLHDVLVGYNLATTYEITSGSVIEALTNNGKENLVVKGIFRTYSHYDDGILISQKGLSELNPEHEENYNYIEIRSHDIKNLIQRYKPPNNLKLVPSIAMQDYILRLALEVRNDLYLISAIITALTLVTVTHTMYKILSDSTQELMILRSLGVSRTGINWIIILDTIILSLTGTVLGIILGNVLTNTSSIFAFTALKLVYTSIRFDWTLVTFCFATSLIVGLLGGVISIELRKPGQETYGSLKQI